MFIMKECSKGCSLAGLHTVASRPTSYLVTTGQPEQPCFTDFHAQLSNFTGATGYVI